MNYQAIVFDVSDTLVEYSPNYAQIYGDRLRYLGFDISEDKGKEISKMVNLAIGDQNLRERNGEPHIQESELNELLDKAALLCVTDDSGCYQQYLSKLRELPIAKQRMKVISDVFPVLDIIKNKYRLAIVSNHYTWLIEELEKMNLASYFETIIISETVGVSKPDIRIMEILLNELKLNAADCVYIGDQPMDVLCAKEVGMDCAWIADQNDFLPESIPYQADHRISGISDLLHILA